MSLDQGLELIVQDIDTTTGPQGYTLPVGSTQEVGQEIFIKNEGGNDLTITGNGTDLIDENTSIVIKEDEEGIRVRWNGTQREVVGEYDESGRGDDDEQEIVQPGHGFAVLETIYLDPTDGLWKKAQADSDVTLGYYNVIEVIDSDTIAIVSDGAYEFPSHGLALGDYYLSDTVAGGYTQTPPADSGEYVLKIFEVIDADTIYFHVHSADEAGGLPSGLVVQNDLGVGTTGAIEQGFPLTRDTITDTVGFIRKYILPTYGFQLEGDNNQLQLIDTNRGGAGKQWSLESSSGNFLLTIPGQATYLQIDNDGDLVLGDNPNTLGAPNSPTGKNAKMTIVSRDEDVVFDSGTDDYSGLVLSRLDGTSPKETLDFATPLGYDNATGLVVPLDIPSKIPVGGFNTGTLTRNFNSLTFSIGTDGKYRSYMPGTSSFTIPAPPYSAPLGKKWVVLLRLYTDSSIGNPDNTINNDVDYWAELSVNGTVPTPSAGHCIHSHNITFTPQRIDAQINQAVNGIFNINQTSSSTITINERYEVTPVPSVYQSLKNISYRHRISGFMFLVNS